MKNGELRIGEYSETPSELSDKLIITDMPKVLRTMAQWWKEGAITMDGVPTVKRFVNFMITNCEVLMKENSNDSYGESRLRHYFDDFLHGKEIKKNEKDTKKP